jgi:4-hydroxy-tetrahydrodipicolinate reductase
MLRVALLGATGRMGRAVLEALPDWPDLELSGALASPASRALGRDAGEAAGLDATGVAVTADRGVALAQADVAIDFSLGVATQANVEACAARGCALVLGTTGYDAAAAAAVRAAAGRIAIVQAPNMSLGVNLCFALVAHAARVLRHYDVEIVDLHHRAKRDAPSGTALRFGEVVAAARGTALVEARRAGSRPPDAVGFSSLRLGEGGGEHTVYFASPHERVEITHRSAGRAAYAAGALAAARWVAGRAPGLHGMEDVLGLEIPGATS